MPTGPLSILLIVVVALLVFGPKKLPELGRAFGSSLREFKNATRGLVDDDEDEERKKKTKLEDEVK